MFTRCDMVTVTELFAVSAANKVRHINRDARATVQQHDERRLNVLGPIYMHNHFEL